MLIEEFIGFVLAMFLKILIVGFPTYWLSSFGWRMGFELGEAWGGAMGHQRAMGVLEQLGKSEGMNRIVDEAFLEKFNEMI